MEEQFSVSNTELMQRLHPITAAEQPKRSLKSFRQPRVVPEIKIESEDEDSDVQVISDDDCKVIETTRPPIKRKTPAFKDFQYELPGKKSRESGKEVVIDL